MTLTELCRRALPLSARALALEDAPITWLMAKALEVPGLLSLAAGFVDRATLPHDEMAKVAQQMLLDPSAGRESLQYGTTAGDPGLRQCLLERLATDAAVWRSVEADDLVITGGSQQLLYLLNELFLEPGDLVLVENPSYFAYVGALDSFGCTAVGVDTDDAGMDPASLDRELGLLAAAGQLERVKLLYVMTYSQNPNGSTLSAERRPVVWEVFERWSEKGLNAVVLEDAAYRHLRFPGVDDLPPLFEFQSENERVCYLESFSKVLSPGLRLGFGVLPKPVREALLRLKSHHDFGSSNFSQQLILRTLRSGLFDRHLETLRGRYEKKCSLLRGLLEAELGDAVELITPSGGLYLWMTLKDDIDTGMAGDLFQRALEEKVLYVPGELCSVPTSAGSSGCRSAMRLCYGYPSDEELVEAGRRLVTAIRSQL